MSSSPFKRAPNTIRVQQLIRGKIRLVLHRNTTAYPISQVVPLELRCPGVLDFPQRAKSSKPAPRVSGVKITVDAANRQRTDITNSHRQQISPHITIREFDGLDRGLVKECLEIGAGCLFRGAVPFAEISPVQIVFLIGGDGGCHAHLQVRIPPPASPLRFTWGELLDHDADRPAGTATGACGLINQSPAATEPRIHQRLIHHRRHPADHQRPRLRRSIRQIRARVFRQRRQRHVYRRWPGRVVGELLLRRRHFGQNTRVDVNPKSETRNPKQIRMTKKGECPKRAVRVFTLSFFWICFGFRISSFGFTSQYASANNTCTFVSRPL